MEKKLKIINRSLHIPSDWDCRDCVESECFQGHPDPSGIYYCPAIQEVVATEEENVFIILDKA